MDRAIFEPPVGNTRQAAPKRTKYTPYQKKRLLALQAAVITRESSKKNP